MTWTSSNGVVLRDLVPSTLRRQWVERGHCPDRDLYSLFNEHVRAHPERTAVIDAEGELDYATLDARVRRFASALAGSGLGPRDIVGIQLPNGWRMVVAELAVAAIGAVALAIPAGRGWRERRSLESRSRASMVITDVTMAGDPSWQPTPVGPEAPARILVSSGSESEPKMVAYSHNAMAGGRGNYVGALHDGLIRNLVLVPLASAMGSCGTSVTLCRHGGTLLLLDAFSPDAALRMITDHRPTMMFAVPTMLRRMNCLPGGDASSLRVVVSSSAALHPADLRDCQARFGCDVVNVYGSADGVNSRDGMIDPAVCDIRIIDGEICARGPMTPLCYVSAPELDARYRMPDGWVRTGDRGEIGADGRLRVLGRIKQIVVRGGYKISPAEIEGLLGTHPAVADVACAAVPDSDLGERLCAYIVQRQGADPVTLAQLTAFLENEHGLERRKLPELLVILPELPLGPTGKVDVRQLGRAHDTLTTQVSSPAPSKSRTTTP